MSNFHIQPYKHTICLQRVSSCSGKEIMTGALLANMLQACPLCTYYLHRILHVLPLHCQDVVQSIIFNTSGPKRKYTGQMYCTQMPEKCFSTMCTHQTCWEWGSGGTAVGKGKTASVSQNQPRSDVDCTFVKDSSPAF